MSEHFFIQVFSAFGAGFLASLSPCVYPMLPITVGYFGRGEDQGQNKKVGFFVLGQVITLTILGVVAVTLGETFGFSSESRSINIFVGIFLLLMGLLSIKGKLPGFLGGLNQKFNNLGTSPKTNSLSALLLGIGSALVTSPCTTPILSAVLAMMATAGTLFKGTTVMFFYSLGFSAFLALISLGVLNLKKLPKSGQWMVYLHKISAILLIVIGVYYICRGFGLLF
jgi:cytochrome c biogenesis protein CcdA